MAKKRPNGDDLTTRESLRALHVLVEDLQSTIQTVAEAQVASDLKDERRHEQLRAEMNVRFEVLEAAVRQNSQDIRQNSQDIRKNSEDIRDLADRFTPLVQRVTVLEERVAKP
jgi:hypothetical protein